MLDKIQHINPREIKDNATLQNTLILSLNVIEKQASQIEQLSKLNQELKDEINRLKGEHGSLLKYSPKSRQVYKVING
jgi:cell division protein FtsB